MIPKKDKDIRYLKNWRPVSLLNTDYKILTKALAQKLQKVIGTIVNEDQVGYIKGRYIGEAIRTIEDVMSASKMNNITGYITLIDFEKAFDSIEWSLLWQCLTHFNFGEQFITWIKILYQNIKSCVGNNGYYTESFDVSRSVRQGCPISALLFVLVAELVAISIRSNTDIKGISLMKREFKIAQLADDTTLFLADLQSVQRSTSLFERFSLVSGLKVNLEKSEIIPIGLTSTTDSNWGHDILKYNKGPFKTLGIWFSYDKNESIKLNYQERLNKMKVLTNIWSSRNLSLKGKVTIIKSLILPQVSFLFSVLFTPDQILNEINKILFSFLWGNKTAKIKKDTIIGNISDGGLKMPDIISVHKTAKISWIKRLSDMRQSKWKTLMLDLLNLKFSNLNHKLPLNQTKNCKSAFHKQVLENWIYFKNIEPSSKCEVLNEYIFNSAFIQTDGSSLTPKMFGLCNTTKNYGTKIIDIINMATGKTLDNTNLNTKLDWNLNFLQYLRLRNIVNTSTFLAKITRQDQTTIGENNRLPDKIYGRVRTKLQEITEIKPQQIYQELISRTVKQPTSQNTWSNLFTFLENHSWEDTYTLPFKVISEPYYQSFQYKVIHRIINCKENLHKWKLTDSPKCDYCMSIDTLEHHLYYCSSSKVFWEKMSQKIKDTFDINIHFTVCEIMLGLNLYQDPLFYCINYLILIGKWYINKVKNCKKEINFTEFLIILKSKLHVLHNIYNKKNELNTSETHFCTLYRLL